MSEPTSQNSTLPKGYFCWICGQRGKPLAGYSIRYSCEKCACQWLVRVEGTPETERAKLDFREAHLARQAKMELVDFTKPGALSSPA